MFRWKVFFFLQNGGGPKSFKHESWQRLKRSRGITKREEGLRRSRSYRVFSANILFQKRTWRCFCSLSVAACWVGHLLQFFFLIVFFPSFYKIKLKKMDHLNSNIVHIHVHEDQLTPGFCMSVFVPNVFNVLFSLSFASVTHTSCLSRWLCCLFCFSSFVLTV